MAFMEHCFFFMKILGNVTDFSHGEQKDQQLLVFFTNEYAYRENHPWLQEGSDGAKSLFYCTITGCFTISVFFIKWGSIGNQQLLEQKKKENNVKIRLQVNQTFLMWNLLYKGTTKLRAGLLSSF